MFISKIIWYYINTGVYLITNKFIFYCFIINYKIILLFKYYKIFNFINYNFIINNFINYKMKLLIIQFFLMDMDLCIYLLLFFNESIPVLFKGSDSLFPL